MVNWKFWQKKPKAPLSLKAIYRLALKRQRDMIQLITKSKCPKCKSQLSLIGYENAYDLTHYEYAVLCDKCKSRFLFTETGLKGEYTLQ